MYYTRKRVIFSANQTRLLLLVCTFTVGFLFVLAGKMAFGQQRFSEQTALTLNVSEIQLLAQDAAESDRFGHSVSVDGDVAIVGAPFHDENADYTGAAYLFRNDGPGWQQEQKITANDGAEADAFGITVAVSGDYAIVGALGDDDLGSSSGAVYFFHYDGTSWIQKQKITASDGAEGDLFGFSVAINGDYALIAAIGDDDLGNSSGSAYLFAYDGESWAQEQKINASDGAELDNFGSSVALDGEVVLVGAPRDDDNGLNAGAAYLFRYDALTQSLQQEQKVTGSASGDDFGRSVSVKGDYAIVGAPYHDHLAANSGAAYLFGYDGTAWELVQSKITASDQAESDGFGSSVSLSDEYVVVAAPKQDVHGADSGALYLFAYDAQSWTDTNKITPFLGAKSDFFGYRLSVSGDSLLVGAFGFDDNIAGEDSGAAYFYNLAPGDVPDIALSLTSSREMVSSGGTHTTILSIANIGRQALAWQISQEASVTMTPTLGTIEPQSEQAVSIEFDAATLMHGTYTSTLSITSNDPDEPELLFPMLWQVISATSEIKLQADEQNCCQFGSSVALDHQLALVGAPLSDEQGQASGAAHLYRFSDASWQKEATLLASDGAEFDHFGASVSLDGEVALVGAPQDDNQEGSGAAYIFRLVDESWQVESKLQPQDVLEHVRFGASVSIKDDLAIVGAPEDHAQGIYSGAVYIFRFDGANWLLEQKIYPASGQENDYFGGSVALSGDILLVGAEGDDQLGTNSGAAYIFSFDGTSWQESAKLVGSDSDSNDRFGTSVSLDGNLVLIGAPAAYGQTSTSGAAYLFASSGQGWQEAAKLSADSGDYNDLFGQSVSISGDLVFISAPRDDDQGTDAGAVYIFEWDGQSSQQEVKLVASFGTSNDHFGEAVALSDEMVIVGAPLKDDPIAGEDSGAAYLYNLSPGDVPDIALSERSIRARAFSDSSLVTVTLTIANPGTEPLMWNLSGDFPFSAEPASGTLEPSLTEVVTLELDAANFGWGQHQQRLTIASNDPDEALIDVPVLLLVSSPETALLDGTSNDQFGEAVSVSEEWAVVGVPGDDLGSQDSGAARVYHSDGEAWLLTTTLTGTTGLGAKFGSSVSLSDDLIIVGAPKEEILGLSTGAAYLFRRQGEAWLLEQRLAGDGNDGDQFGASVSVSGEIAIVGAYGDDEHGASSGAAYLYRFDGSSWQLLQKISASDASQGDEFGRAVSISGERAIIGAHRDDANGPFSGAAYIFRFDGNQWLEEAKLVTSDGAPDDRFGVSVAISDDLAIVGAYLDDDHGTNSGAAYIFRAPHGSAMGPISGREIEGGWTESAKLVASDGAAYDFFAYSVSIGEDVALIGAPLDDGWEKNSGAFYLYRFNGSNWYQGTKLSLTDASQDDHFGHAVAVAGGVALVGVPLDDSNGQNTGAAYLYDIDSYGRQPVLDLSSGSSEYHLLPDEQLTDTLTIGNLGSEPLTWAISASASWLGLNPISDTVHAATTQSITIRLDTSSLLAGTYTDTLIISSNDPISPTVELPITLIVHSDQGPTATPSATETLTATNTPTSTDTPTATPSATETPIDTPTATFSPSPSITGTTEPATSTPTVTPTVTANPTVTTTATSSPTGVPTVIASSTSTATSTATSTSTTSNTPTSTHTPTVTGTIANPASQSMIYLPLVSVGISTLSPPSNGAQEQTITIDVQTPEYTLSGDELHVEGYEINAQPGAPALPVWHTLVELPPTGEWELAYDLNEWQELTIEEPLRAVLVPELPAEQRESWRRLGELPSALTMVERPDASIYNRDAFYPAQPVIAGQEEWQRGQRLLSLRVFPFQYNPVTGVLRYHPDVKALIEISGAGEEPLRGPKKNINQRINQAATGLAAYRIYTTERGLYRLTYQDLQEAGVPVETVDPALFAISYLGESVAIQVRGESDGSFDEGDLLIFYAEPYEGRYMTENVYWFTFDGPASPRMATRAVTPTIDDPVVNQITQTLRVEINEIYASALERAKESDHFYDNPLFPSTNAPTQTVSYPLALDDYISSDGQVLSLQTTMYGEGIEPKSIKLWLNEQLAGSYQWNGQSEYTATTSLPTTWLAQSGDNQVTLEASLYHFPPDERPTQYAIYPDWIEIKYPAWADLSGEAQRLYIEGLVVDSPSSQLQIQVTGLTSPTVQVVDVREPRHPVELLTTEAVPAGSEWTFSFWDENLADATYFLSTEAALLAPSRIEQDSPSSLHSERVADYIAIVHPSLWTAPDGLSGIDELLAHRAAEGLRVAKIDVQDIYDEFSGGRLEPEAIRSFLTYAYYHWNPGEEPPKYVILVGDGHVDFKNHTNTPLLNLIPPYLLHIDHWIGETATDNRFVSVDGPDDYLPDMSIGRLPAQIKWDEASQSYLDPAVDVEAMVNKIINYETATSNGPWQKRVIFGAGSWDDSAGNHHVISDNIRYNWLPPSYEDIPIYYNSSQELDSGTEMRAAIKEAYNNDAFMLQWFGHGSPYRWGGPESMFNLYDPEGYQGHEPLEANSEWAVTVAYGCLSSYFVAFENIGNSNVWQSLGESLVRAPARGSVADIGSSGLHTGSAALLLNQGVIKAIFQEHIERVGPALDASKSHFFQNTTAFHDVIDSHLLLGDPATRLRLPLFDLKNSTITVDSPEPQAGQQVTFNVELVNNGNEAFSDILLMVDYDEDKITVNSASGAVDDGETLTWNEPLLPVGITIRPFTATLKQDLPAGTIIETEAKLGRIMELLTLNHSLVIVTGD